MNDFRNIRIYLVFLVVVSLVIIGIFQQVFAKDTATTNTSKQCVQRDGLTFNGVGLWTSLPTVLKFYGQPVRIEPMASINKDRVNAHYSYKDIKLFIFNSTVWQVDILASDISSKSGIRLLNDISAVEKRLGVTLRNPISGPNNKIKYKFPFCPPDPPEVEEYVIPVFDQNKRITDFTVVGIMP